MRFVSSLLSLLLLCGISEAGEMSLISAGELDTEGILVWTHRLPEDLGPGEFAALRWRLNDPDIDSDELESGLDFRGFPAGAEFKVSLWIGEFFLEDRRGGRIEPEGVRYCFTHRKKDGKRSSRYGIMRFPKGWNELYGYLPSQAYAALETGSVLMLYNPEKEGTNGSLACLDLVYETATSEQPPKASE